jgi:hypothetical protein
MGNGEDVLDKTVASAATAVVLLELHEFELTKGLKNVLEVCFRDTKMDVADIEPMERDRVGVTGRF